MIGRRGLEEAVDRRHVEAVEAGRHRERRVGWELCGVVGCGCFEWLVWSGLEGLRSHGLEWLFIHGLEGLIGHGLDRLSRCGLIAHRLRLIAHRLRLIHHTFSRCRRMRQCSLEEPLDALLLLLHRHHLSRRQRLHRREPQRLRVRRQVRQRRRRLQTGAEADVLQRVDAGLSSAATPTRSSAAAGRRTRGRAAGSS